MQNINKFISSIIMFMLSTVVAYSQMPITSDSQCSNDIYTCSEDNKPVSVEKYAPYRHIVSTPVLPDSADVRMHEHKAFWRAGAETVGFNIGLWAFDRYVLKGHYAYISWNTIKENFRHGFEWDDDHLHTCLTIPTTALYFSMPDAPMVSISGSRSCSPSAEVPCGRCLWNVNTPLPTT